MQGHETINFVVRRLKEAEVRFEGLLASFLALLRRVDFSVSMLASF